jgi:hypothetical protein
LSPYSSSCGKVQLPPLSCVGFERNSSHPSRRTSEPTVSSSISSVTRSRSSSLSEAASSITQSLQTPRTITPPRHVLIGGGTSSGFGQVTGSRVYPIAFHGSSLKSEPMTTSPPFSENPNSLVPLSLLENIRSTQSAQYSLPIPYGPSNVTARRAVDEQILKGLTS